MSRTTLEDDSSDRLVFIYSPDGSTGYQVGRRNRNSMSHFPRVLTECARRGPVHAITVSSAWTRCR